jgi:hypothetical protein
MTAGKCLPNGRSWKVNDLKNQLIALNTLERGGILMTLIPSHSLTKGRWFFEAHKMVMSYPASLSARASFSTRISGGKSLLANTMQRFMGSVPIRQPLKGHVLV